MKHTVLSKEEEAIEKDFDLYQPVPKETKRRIEKIIENSRKSRLRKRRI